MHAIANRYKRSFLCKNASAEGKNGDIASWVETRKRLVKLCQNCCQKGVNPWRLQEEL
jgi:hypothetical protein